MIASPPSPSPSPSFNQHRKENRKSRPPPSELNLELDIDHISDREPFESCEKETSVSDIDGHNEHMMDNQLEEGSRQVGTEPPTGCSVPDGLRRDQGHTMNTNTDSPKSSAKRQRARSALADLGTALNTDITTLASKDKISDMKRPVEIGNFPSKPITDDRNAGAELPGTHRKPEGVVNGSSHAPVGYNGERKNLVVQDLKGSEEGSEGETPLEEPRHQHADGVIGGPRREPSPRRGRDKEKILKLSPEKIQELTSSPESIPYRAMPIGLDQGQKGIIADIPPLSLRTGPHRLDERTPLKRPVDDGLKTPNNLASKIRGRKDVYLDDPPGFLGALEQAPSSAPLRQNPHASRTVSTPASARQRRSSISNERFAQTWAQRSKHDRSAPNRIDIEPRHALSQIADPTPSPMPQSIPLPPLSIPTYLQLELSSSRPSPLYIHRSITSDFPYESSRVKIERLQNFFTLPPALEQVLWFGALTCLDSWLYCFTILPLRFIKALYILVQSWAVNLSVEIQFISGFVVKGVGRVWRRRRNPPPAKAPGQRGAEDGPGSRNVSGSSWAKWEPSLSDRDLKNPSSVPQPENGRRPGRSISHKHRRQKSIPSALLPDDKADILKGLLMIATCSVLMYFDASRVYHWIRGQAAIKLYVIYNVLEVSDRLLSAIGQDVLECLFSREALERRPDGRSKVFRPFWLFLLALAYTVIHAISLFYQVITLNVAVNSYSNALITLLLSNQFVEIKSTVFKKFEKENLFQLTCADVVERFQLWLMLIIIASRNIVETGAFSFFGTIGTGFGSDPSASTDSTPLSTPPRSSSSILPQSFTLFPSSLFASFSGVNSFLPNVGQVLGPFLVVLGSEMLVDWLKHAYINKFNNTRPAIYGRFLDVLAKDYYTNAFADQNLTRRLGLPVIPLSCLFFRVSVQTYQMFITAWLPQLPSSTSSNATSLSSIHRHYAPSASPSSEPLTFRTAIPTSINHITSFLQSVIANATPSPARSLPVFTIIIVLTGYLVLLIFKLALGILLLSFARSRYKAMKTREQEVLFRPANGAAAQKSSQTSAPSASRAREYVVEGGRRVGGWGVVEVDDEKKRWIYVDDPEGMKKVREREEKERSGKDTGAGIEGVRRYEMVAKRIW